MNYGKTFYLLFPLFTAVASLAQESDPEIIWEQIQPSKNLTWVPCYTNRECARLEVPLDYAEPSGAKGSVAIVKIPAKVNQTSQYRGPMLFNPGGPGESGVTVVAAFGDLLQQVVGEEYDIIGFDPRGVGRTIPKIVTFPDRNAGTSWALQSSQDPLPNMTSYAIAQLYARAKVTNSVAAVTTKDTSPYVSTAITARDMLSIVRAYGLEKIQYWGVSYGTVLGATYAAMFPDKIERMVIDGVVDPVDYYSGTLLKNLLTTDENLQGFAEACSKAGPSACALYEPSATQVLSRIRSILDSLKHQPLAVTTNGTSSYDIVTYRMAQSSLFSLLYSPYLGSVLQPYPASDLATAFAAVEKGDGRPLLTLYQIGAPIPQFECDCNNTATPALGQAAIAIQCVDATANNDTIASLEQWYQELAAQSSFADIWTVVGVRIGCAGWTIKPKEAYTGPFVGNTSHPILLIGNTADVVTPLVNAYTVSKGFNGSVVLTQNSFGHTSLAATSSCTFGYIRAYFQNGTLPTNGTVCEVENKIFP